MRRRPSFGLYLAALLALPVAGLAPLGILSDHASWTDVLVAAAALVWAAEVAARPRSVPRPIRGIVVALAGFIALSSLSAAFASAHGEAAVNLLLEVELLVLALLTADYARSRAGRDGIVLAIGAGALATVVLAVLGVALFYLGRRTALIGAYGEQFIASDAYVRSAAGFASPPLLADYCIVAAAILALESHWSPRLRRFAELALGLVVILTLSRAILGFIVALLIRHAARRGASWSKKLAGAASAAAVVAMLALSVGRLHLDPTRPSTISYVVPDPANRREEFASSLRTMASHPLLGTGPGSLPGTSRGQPFRAHFTPLNIAATVGVPALGALAAALSLAWGRRPRPTDVALWSGFAGVGIDAMGQDVEHFRHVWILIGLAIAAAASGRDARRPPSAAGPGKDTTPTEAANGQTAGPG